MFTFTLTCYKFNFTLNLNYSYYCFQKYIAIHDSWFIFIWFILRTDDGISDPRAWLMCAWSFSPYDADWWACKVSLDSTSGGIARLMWTQHSYGSLPTICSTNELASEAAKIRDIDDIQWAFAGYKVQDSESNTLCCLKFELYFQTFRVCNYVQSLESES